MSGNHHVRFECLNSTNYDTWKLHAQAVLVKNNAWAYVNGKKTRPTNVDAAEEWDVEDEKAKSDLILAISASELKQIKTCVTSREIWLKLESIYQSKGPARKATLLKRLILVKMRDGENIREHLATFFDAVDKLEEMNLVVNCELLSILLLYSLPDSFENFRCAIESRDELPKPEALKIKLMEEFDARKSKDGDVSNAMFAGKGRQSSSYKNYEGSGRKGNSHLSSNPSKFMFKCHHCKIVGHKAADCRKRLVGIKQKARNVEDDNSYVISEDQMAFHTATGRSGRWCLDSGATSHMCKLTDEFNELSKTNRPLNLANSGSTQIEGIGEINLAIQHGKTVRNAKLSKVLHVPDLRTNLMSVSKITDNGYEVTFKKNSALVKNANGDVTLVADRVKNLYFIRESGEKAGIASTGKSKLTEWHEKLNHVNERSLKEMARDEKVLGLKFNSKEKLHTCEICIKGKQTQTPFPKSQPGRSKQLLEIIHSDVCGPMRTKSIGGANYFITFIDDKSRWCEVQFLKKKSDALEAFKKFAARVENYTGHKIKALQSDNGTEYVNNEFNEYLKLKGIKRRLTVPDTPEQNGVSERMNRTLETMARCAMIQSKLPPSFWAEAINTANHVRNRIVCRTLNGETPYKLWTGKRPTVAHFKIFGSKVLALNKSTGKGKFDTRSKECIFLGYSEESKAYRLWVTSEKRTIVSRDVKVIEDFGDATQHEIRMSRNNYVDFLLDETTEIPHVNEQVVHKQNNRESETDETQRTDKKEPLLESGSGRPRLSKSGNRGIPTKEYNLRSRNQDKTDNLEDEEIAEYAGQIGMLDPLNVTEALQSPESGEWREAIKNEYMAQIKCRTWEIVNCPKNRKKIGSRIILRTKYNAEGEVERRKARLVAKGYAQQPGVDFNETFAPVARSGSIRMIMALSAEYGLIVHQMT